MCQNDVVKHIALPVEQPGGFETVSFTYDVPRTRHVHKTAHVADAARAAGDAAQPEPMLNNSVEAADADATHFGRDSKRRAPGADGQPQTKRRRGAGRAELGKVEGDDRVLVAVLKGPMERLRAVLQSMEVAQRRGAIEKMTPRLRERLFAFMEARQRQGGATFRRVRAASVESEDLVKAAEEDEEELIPSLECPAEHPGNASVPASGIPGVKVVTCLHGNKYVAQVYFKALALYTLTSNLHQTTRQQDVLARIRRAAAAESAVDPCFWIDPSRVFATCQAAIREGGATEEKVAIRAFVKMRASRWLGQRCEIVSPAMDLASALVLHARLLRARDDSWEAFRAEWVRLLQCSSYSRRRPLAKLEAEAVADKARRLALDAKLHRALRIIKGALEREATRRNVRDFGKRSAAIGDL